MVGWERESDHPSKRQRQVEWIVIVIVIYIVIEWSVIVQYDRLRERELGGHLSKRQRQVEWIARRSGILPQAADWVNLPRPGCCVFTPIQSGLCRIGDNSL